jgi:hypothetical protein
LQAGGPVEPLAGEAQVEVAQGGVGLARRPKLSKAM